MKKYLFLIMFGLLMFSTITAEKIKVAIINYRALDNNSKYFETPTLDRDFTTLLKGDDKFELLKPKNTRKAFSKKGIENPESLDNAQLKDAVSDLGADLVIWVEANMIDKNNFRLRFIYQALDLDKRDAITLNTVKNGKERRAMMQELLIPELKALYTFDCDRAFMLTDQFLKNEDYDNAIIQLDKILQNDPQNLNALKLKGYALFKKKMYDESSEVFQQALNLDSENEEILKLLISNYLQIEAYDEAIEALNKIIENNPSAKKYYQLGLIYKEQKNFNGDDEIAEEGIEAFQKSLELDPKYDLAAKELGTFLYQMQRFDEAIAPLEQATDAFPEDENLSLYLADSYIKADKIDSAINKYKTVLETKPNDTKIQSRLVKAFNLKISKLKNEGKTNEVKKIAKEAENILKTILSKDKNNEFAVFNLADIYINSDDYSSAKNQAEKAIASFPKNPKGYRLLAKITDYYAFAKYQEYVKYDEEQRAGAVGERADQLSTLKKEAKQEAYNLFEKEEKYLNKALELSTDAAARNNIKNQLKQVKEYLKTTSADFF